MPDLTSTRDPTVTNANSRVIAVDNVGGSIYGKATGLYNKHCKYSEQWNPLHPFQSAHDFQRAKWFRPQTQMWIDEHFRDGLDNFKRNHVDQQMPCESSTLNSIPGSVMIVGLMIIRISLEHYTTGILSNVYSSF